MISVKEAKQLIQIHTWPSTPVSLPLQQAAGLVLAQDISATISIPAFNQSSMDGYAFSWTDWQTHRTLKIQGAIPAGITESRTLLPGQATRIFTGAAVPEGADTVVMQEKIILENALLTIKDEQLQQGQNVRLKGSEIRAGALALPKGSNLSPAAMGFLAGIGTTQVTVYPAPAVSIIITGNELQQPGIPLQYGQVYESNSYSLTAALQQVQVRQVQVLSAPDELDQLAQVLAHALQNSDVVLLTGGISVGDYDFVLEAATRCGVHQVFHRIKQRPGKPLYFGKRSSQLVFGLPGNPSSVLTCFYEYVVPALEQLMSKTGLIKQQWVPIALPYQKKISLTQFLKARYDGHSVTPLDAQESYRLSSFATANCLVCLDEGEKEYEAGELVEIHILPS